MEYIHLYMYKLLGTFFFYTCNNCSLFSLHWTVRYSFFWRYVCTMNIYHKNSLYALWTMLLLMKLWQGKPAPLCHCSYRRCSTGGLRVQLVLLDSKLSGPGPSSCRGLYVLVPTNLLLRVNLWWTSIPFHPMRITGTCSFVLQKTEIHIHVTMIVLMGHYTLYTHIYAGFVSNGCIYLKL